MLPTTNDGSWHPWHGERHGLALSWLAPLLGKLGLACMRANRGFPPVSVVGRRHGRTREKGMLGSESGSNPCMLRVANQPV